MSKDGKITWDQHEKGLLNHLTNIDEFILGSLNRLKTSVSKVKQINKNKLSGTDSIPAEVLKCDGERIVLQRNWCLEQRTTSRLGRCCIDISLYER